MSSSAVPIPTQEPGRADPPFAPSLVAELLRQFGKAVRAHQLYLHNNPTYLRSVESLKQSFAALWQRVDELVLLVAETELRWEGATVFEDADKSPDNLAWLLYKDGIRELRFLPGFEEEEVVRMLDIIQRVRHAAPDADDLLTLLWEEDLLTVRYRYIDLALENAPPMEGAAGERRPRLVESPRVEEEAVAEAPRAGIVNVDSFDATLYFLDEREIEYLQSEVRKEYESNLKRSVLSMLLDIFEGQADAAVRDELCGILDNFVLHLLSAGQFSSVAFLLREAAIASQRSRELAEPHRAKLVALPDRLSDAAALSQLLEGLDGAPELPPQDELNELFDQLRPAALGTVFGWLGRLQNVKLRTLLETAAARLAASNTAELVRLIGAPERAVSLEAMRRAGALRSAAAVAPIGKVIEAGDADARLVAVQALAEIGSPGALQVLERAVEDESRDVRVATARAVAARQHRPALARVEAIIKSKGVREADLTEKMAVFEAYGSLCGEAGVELLDELLNGKGFLGRREDPELRACAAMALGRVGSERAVESLRRATAEKEVLVRNAVNRALRGGSA